jgi:hypothetical protein
MLPIFRNTLMATTAKATGALFLAALICSSTAAAGAIKLDADTVQEFMNAAHQKFGGNLLGKTNVNPKDNWRFDKSKGMLIDVSFACPVVSSDFAAFGKGSSPGKPDKNNSDAITEVARLAQDHEKKHKDGYEAVCKNWKPDEEANALMQVKFKDGNEAHTAVLDKRKDLVDKLKKACLDLHKQEGLLEVKPQSDGSFVVSMKPAGATGCEIQ